MLYIDVSKATQKFLVRKKRENTELRLFVEARRRSAGRTRGLARGREAVLPAEFGQLASRKVNPLHLPRYSPVLRHSGANLLPSRLGEGPPVPADKKCAQNLGLVRTIAPLRHKGVTRVKLHAQLFNANHCLRIMYFFLLLFT